MAIQFNIYWAYIQGTGLAGTKISNIGTSPFHHTGLDAFTAYWYVMTSYDTIAAVESAVSNEVSAVPFAAFDSFQHIIW